MKQNRLIRMALALAAAVGCAAGAAVQASEVDDGIGPAFQETYVYKVYLQEDDIDIAVSGGAVTMTGTVAEETNRTIAQDLMVGVPGVVSVDNQLVTREETGAGNPPRGSAGRLSSR